MRTREDTSASQDDAEAQALLSVRGIHKKFGGTYALQNVSFDIRQGEVLALLGENGAGKSTLIKILAGVHSLDEGEILFEGQSAHRHIADLPIAFIHQDLGLVDWMTVAENVSLTRGFDRRFGLISWAGCRRTARDALKSIGVDVDPDTRVRSLSRTEQSLVAIARAITTKAKIVVMDEPTASLPADEVARLFEAVRSMREHGVAVIYVSHRLEEIFAIADRVVVLRDGRLVGDRSIHETEPDDLVRLIVGSAVMPIVRTSVAPMSRPVWQMIGAVADGVGPVSFSVKAGEMVGLTGLRGAGQETIGRAIFGLIPLEKGDCRLDGNEIDPAGPSSSIATGLRFASGDRRGESVVQGFSVAENLFLNPCTKNKSPLSPIAPRAERQAAYDLGGFLRLSPNDPRMLIENLSGGNQQKVVLGRWLNLKGKLLILEDPTAGVDVGAKGEIYRLLFQALETGLSIIVISTDFVEVAAICHRALVFSRGAIVSEIAEADLTAEALLGAAAVTKAEDFQTEGSL
ncbi:MAG TPA: sugar ABC transporter ATP-binding protein [Roseiarcus sp.]